MNNNGWIQVPLSHIVEIIGGGTPKTTVSDYWNGEIPWISVADLGSGKKFIYDTEKKVTKLGLENSSTKLIQKGQIIISARGTVGELGVVSKEMAFNQSCYGLNAKDQTNNEFLYYLLLFNIDQFKKKTHGSVFETITRETFDQIIVDLPPLPVQQKIASILGSLDDKIELNRRMNKTLEEIARAIFRHMFVENPEAKGWKVLRIGDFIENFDSQRIPLSRREREKRKGQYPYYGATSIMDYVDDFLFDGIHILLAEDGSVIDENNHPVIQYVWGQFWVNNHAHVLLGRNGISNEYLYLFLKEVNIIPYITGAVQPKINQANMNSIPFLAPPKNLCEQFNNVVVPIFSQIRNNCDENQTLVLLRDLLLLKLLRGEGSIFNQEIFSV